jgi:hypothetical protein
LDGENYQRRWVCDGFIQSDHQQSDTNSQVIPNVAVFSNKGTPSCSATTSETNAVQAKGHRQGKGLAGRVGEPFAGSRLYEIAILVFGAGLLARGGRSWSGD